MVHFGDRSIAGDEGKRTHLVVSLPSLCWTTLVDMVCSGDAGRAVGVWGEVNRRNRGPEGERGQRGEGRWKRGKEERKESRWPII